MVAGAVRQRRQGRRSPRGRVGPGGDRRGCSEAPARGAPGGTAPVVRRRAPRPGGIGPRLPIQGAGGLSFLAEIARTLQGYGVNALAAFASSYFEVPSVYAAGRSGLAAPAKPSPPRHGRGGCTASRRITGHSVGSPNGHRAARPSGSARRFRNLTVDLRAAGVKIDVRPNLRPGRCAGNPAALPAIAGTPAALVAGKHPPRGGARRLGG